MTHTTEKRVALEAHLVELDKEHEGVHYQFTDEGVIDNEREGVMEQYLKLRKKLVVALRAQGVTRVL